MLTKSLSRADYNKEKKVVACKALQRASSQVSVYSHLVEATQNFTQSVRRYIESEENLDSQQISHLNIEPSLHFYQIQVQDLNRVLAHREDQITCLKNQKEKNDKKIQNLDKTIFDLKTQAKKAQYQYKATINFLKTQNQLQKTQYLERIAFLQQESKKFKQSYENLIQSAHEIYQLRINSYSESKNTYIQASQSICKGLKRDISFYVNRNNRLMDELVHSGMKNQEKILYYQDQNSKLKERLEEKEVQFGLFLMNNDSVIQEKDVHLTLLQKQKEQMLADFARERQQFANKIDSIEKTMIKEQMTIKQNIETILSQKKIAESELLQMQLKCNQIKYQNDLLNNKCIDLTMKLEFSESQKKHQIEKLKQKIDEIKKNSSQSFEDQISSLKKNYEQKILNCKSELEEKNSEIIGYNQKIYSLNREIEKKNYEIKDYQQQQRNKKSCIEKMKSEIKNLKVQIEKMKRQNELILQKYTTNIKYILQESSKIKDEGMNKVLQMENNFILQNHVNDFFQKYTSQSQSQKSEQKKNLSDEKNDVNTPKNKQKISEDYRNYSDSSSGDLRSSYQQITNILQKQGEALLQNEKKIQKLNNQLMKMKIEKVRMQPLIRKLQKHIQIIQSQNQKLKDQARNKQSQFLQKDLAVQDSILIEKNEYLISIKKSENQISILNQKLVCLQEAYSKLQTENQNNIILNEKIQNIVTIKQERLSDLLKKIKQEKYQVLEKKFEKLQQQCSRIQQNCQNLLEQNMALKNQNSKLAQLITNKNNSITMFQKKYKKLKIDQQESLEALRVKNNQISLYEQRIDEHCNQMSLMQQTELRLQSQKQGLTQKLSNYDLYTRQLQKMKIFKIKQVGQMIENNQYLQEQLDNKKKEIEQQAKLIRDLQYTAVQNQVKSLNLENQVRQSIIKQLDEQYKKIIQIKIRQLKKDQEAKSRKMFEKISFLEQEIQKKNLQLKRIDKKLNQSQQYVKQDSQKLKYLEGKVQSFKKQVQMLQKELRSDQRALQEKQEKIIRMGAVINEYHAKEKRNQKLNLKGRQTQRMGYETQRVMIKQNSINIGPLNSIKRIVTGMDQIRQERENIINTLNDKQKQTIELLQKRDGIYLSLTVKGCLDEISRLLTENSHLKESGVDLLGFFKMICNQNYSQGQKFSKIMETFNECHRQFLSVEKEFSNQNARWNKVRNDMSDIKEKEQIKAFHEKKQPEVRQAEKQEEKKKQNQEFKYWGGNDYSAVPAIIPFKNQSEWDVIQDDLSQEDDTLKKDIIKVAIQEAQKIVKHNYRYGKSDKKNEGENK